MLVDLIVFVKFEIPPIPSETIAYIIKFSFYIGSANEFPFGKGTVIVFKVEKSPNATELSVYPVKISDYKLASCV